MESKAYGYLLGSGGAGRGGVGWEVGDGARGGGVALACGAQSRAAALLLCAAAAQAGTERAWLTLPFPPSRLSRSWRGRRAGPVCARRRAARARAGGGGARMCGVGTGVCASGLAVAACRCAVSRAASSAAACLRWCLKHPSPPFLALPLPPTHPTPPPNPTTRLCSWRRLWSCSCLRGAPARRCASSTSACQTAWRRRHQAAAGVRLASDARAVLPAVKTTSAMARCCARGVPATDAGPGPGPPAAAGDEVGTVISRGNAAVAAMGSTQDPGEPGRCLLLCCCALD